MADPVGWCGRLSPCLRVAAPWSSGEPPLPEPDAAIERLLALCAGPGSESQSLLDDDADASQSSSASEEILSNQDLTLDKALIARDLLGECEPSAGAGGEPAAQRPCRAPPEPPSEPGWRRSVSVGADHQAELPRLRPAHLARRRGRPLGDRLLWAPGALAEREVERYQRRLRPAVVSAAGPPQLPPPRRLPDHQQALWQLQEAGHDVDEAARRLSADQLRPAGRLSHFTDHECDLFEQALRQRGKDFSAIQRHTLPNRSVGEIVNFYYLWKKTERHRQFLSQSQLGKRKYGPDGPVSEPSARLASASASSLQILMATESWSDCGPSLAGLLDGCPQLLLL